MALSNYRGHVAAMKKLYNREIRMICENPVSHAVRVPSLEQITHALGSASALDIGTLRLASDLHGFVMCRRIIGKKVNPQLREMGLPEYQMPDEA